MAKIIDAQRRYCAARAAYETISAECRRRVDERFGKGYLPDTDAEMETYCTFEVQSERDMGREWALNAKWAAEDVLLAACKDWAAHNGLSDTTVFDEGSKRISARQKLIDICMSIRA